MFSFVHPEKIRKPLAKWVKRAYYNIFSVTYIDRFGCTNWYSCFSNFESHGKTVAFLKSR